jgi:hypothetical protein
LTAHQTGRAYLDAYRARCVERDLDPATGGQRVFAWPEERKQPHGRPWWAGVDVFAEIGPNASTVEAEAFASIASQVRRIAGVSDVANEADAEYRLRPSMQAEVNALAEDGANAMHQTIMPLRDVHRRQGLIVDEILGVRMVVPIRKTA